jgi:DNA polymerase-3 subunit epsilon
MVNAHNAMADAIATMHIYQAMLSRHADLTAMGRQQLALFSKFDQRIDLAGKLVLIGGKPCYGFGKMKGTPIEDDIGYARWMLDKDFSWNTKMHLRELLDCIRAKNQRRELFERDEPGEPFSSPLDDQPH